MAINVAGFLIGRVVAERQGITDEASINRLSLLGALMGSSPTGLVMTTLLAQREAERAESSPQPAPDSSAIHVEVPDVTEESFREAQNNLESIGLKAQRSDLYSLSTDKDHVIKQSPEPKTIVSHGETVTVFVSLGPELPKKSRHSKSEIAENGLVSSGKTATSGHKS